MNALVSIDVATLTPATVFAPGGVEAIISKIEAEVSTEVFTIDTAEGRERIKSVAYKVARSKTALDDMGKELVSGIKAQAAAVDADRRTIRDRLDALKERVRGPLTAWEDAETARVDGHERAIVFLIQSARFDAPPCAAEIRTRILQVQDYEGRDFQEFSERANAAGTAAMATLKTMLVAAKQAEADAAELAELRRQAAEREEQDRANAAIEAAEVAAQQQAEAAAERKRISDEQEKAREIARAEQTARDVAAAAAKAIEDERLRVARVAAAEKAKADKLAANKKHRAKINSEITFALSEVLTGNADEAAALIEAIAAGRIPHVRIEY